MIDQMLAGALIHNTKGFRSTMRRVMWLLAVVVWWLGCPAVAADNAGGACRFPAVFNFGDSNSDTGGFWAAFPAQRGPFGMTYFGRPAGRASDGRLVVDFVAKALGLPYLSPYLQSVGSDYRHGVNFATLASTVLLPNTSVFVTGISPFSLAIQLNQMRQFRDRVLASKSRHGKLPPKDIFSRALYTMDIGQNDFTSNLGSIGIGVKQYLPAVVNQISWTIQGLYNMGGRNFMVFNLAPIGCYPAFLTQLPHTSNDLDQYGCMTTYNSAVLYYNTLLNDSLTAIRKTLSDATIVYVDKHSMILELCQHPTAHGFTYGTKACCGYGGGAYNYRPDLYCGNSKLVDGVSATAAACAEPRQYVSWDGIHATEAVNKVVASAVLSGSLSDPPFDLSQLCNLQPI